MQRLLQRRQLRRQFLEEMGRDLKEPHESRFYARLNKESREGANYIVLGYTFPKVEYLAWVIKLGFYWVIEKEDNFKSNELSISLLIISMVEVLKQEYVSQRILYTKSNYEFNLVNKT